MPAYYKNTVAELRQICETRGIEHDGLTKPRLIAALREADVRDGCDEEDVEDVGVEGADDEIQLGEHLYGAVGSVSGASVDARQDIAGAEGETESVTALRLKLALKREELRLKEREWEIERERRQFGPQSSRGSNATGQLHSDIHIRLPRLSNSDTDVIAFFHSFERILVLSDVPREDWPSYLLPSSI